MTKNSKSKHYTKFELQTSEFENRIKYIYPYALKAVERDWLVK